MVRLEPTDIRTAGTDSRHQSWASERGGGHWPPMYFEIIRKQSFFNIEG